MSDPWDDLARELDKWAGLGLEATFWLRDDDAETRTPALDRLLGDAGAPVVLAVIPRDAGEALAEAVLAAEAVGVMQHGWCHANHAGPDEKKMELGDHRPSDVIGDELARGDNRLRALFGERYLKALAPPWNRIGADTASRLAGWGYVGLSTFGPRGKAMTAPGLVCVNTHIDIIDWRGTRGFRGDRDVIDQAISHLRGRREGDADSDEPSGLITHHLVHDEGCWGFIEKFVRVTGDHPAVRWLTLHETFAG